MRKYGESGPDLSTLRTFRVLRPLKLVSGVQSKHYFAVGPIPTPKPEMVDTFEFIPKLAEITFQRKKSS